MGTSRPRSLASTRLYLAIATVLIIHIICYRAATPLRRTASPALSLSLHKRDLSLSALASPLDPPSFDDDDTHEPSPPPHEEAASLIDYLGAWDNATQQQRPALFAAFVLWLVFLFAFVGITASDFFCPNLSTIATRLGLSESVAGVTFLAFSNGSPDVFSTFAALRSNSGSLAIGELIGAASFIVSVVAGTMCVIQPFRVSRHTFLRDVGFFTIAVAFTLGILWDSHVHAWEAAAMVGLYVLYVVVVAVGSWWSSRKAKREERIRQARSEYAQENAPSYRDDRHRRVKSRSSVRPSLLGAIEFRDVVNSLRADSTARTLAVFGGRDEHYHASPAPSPVERRPRSASQSMMGPNGGSGGFGRPNLPERERRTTWTAEMGGPPRVPCEEDHGHWGESDEDEDALPESPLIDLSAGVDNPWKGSPSLTLDIPSNAAGLPRTLRRTQSGSSIASKVPSIMLINEDGDQELVVGRKKWAFTKKRWWRITRAVWLALFPSLHEFGSKSIVGKATALLCVPAILALNLTLPVVETEDEADCVEFEDKEGDHGVWDEFGRRESFDAEGHLVDIEEGEEGDPGAGRRREHAAHMLHHGTLAPTSPLPSPSPSPKRVYHLPHPEEEECEIEVPSPWAGASGSGTAAVSGTATPESQATIKPGSPADVDQNVHEHVLTRWLTAVQCTLGPVFCTCALLADDLRWWYPLIALAVGLTIASFAFWCFEDHKHPGRVVLCFVGFFVAMVWILMIVNEVVGVLQTIGHIFGLSDAILGLTIFAMGNSLGDLVANATVARMGYPSMAIAACFGGPMLNILLGVGLSGSYIILTNGGQPLHVEMGKTLLVSGVGLLTVLVSTLTMVPLNGFWMSKRLGMCLILAYFVVLSINIAVEVWW
ncbi:hypothetical protein MNV49_002772 [Pseudohyphozyma bogoriensis]|nr:hypothetical protein MNV49_002772 [Pseudohyphozyma bogoriensis]